MCPTCVHWSIFRFLYQLFSYMKLHLENKMSEEELRDIKNELENIKE